MEVLSLLSSAEAATHIVFLGVGNLKPQPSFLLKRGNSCLKWQFDRRLIGRVNKPRNCNHFNPEILPKLKHHHDFLCQRPISYFPAVREAVGDTVVLPHLEDPRETKKKYRICVDIDTADEISMGQRQQL